jgi:GntR family transcriptional regulator
VQESESDADRLERGRLDRESPIPLHFQVRRAIERELEAGRFEPGAPIPPELELARRFNVGRQTVRQAIGDLVRRGLLTRARGRGTFVTRPQLEQPLGGFYSLAREMEERGLQASSRVLSIGSVEADADSAARLATRVGARLVKIVRLRLVENEPLLLETSLLPHRLGSGLTVAALEAGSLYDLLARSGTVVTGAREVIRPVVLDAAEARLLEVAPGTPALLVDRTARAGERPVEWRVSLIRGDRYAFSVELPPRG